MKELFNRTYPGVDAVLNEILVPVLGDNYETYAEDILRSHPGKAIIATSANIKAIKRIAEFDLDVPLQIFDITMTSNAQLAYSRVNIQRVVRSLMDNYSGALMFFHSEDGQGEWRISFVKKDNSQSNASSSKRYTYLVGEEHSCRTIAERFAILKNKEKTVDSLLEAFSVETMSNEFFDKYKEHYQNFVEFFTGERVVKQGGKWETIKTSQPDSQLIWIFSNDKKAARDFCKKLLGRIIFLYFIQKKGWLGATNGDYQDGDKKFVRHLFDAVETQEVFYSSWLSKLFFETLNKSRENDNFVMPDGKIVKIPFLNGGLFENDFKKDVNIIFPKKLFVDLFNFFDQYNFTIYEDDPNDHTVAVDPEMLGHIFENLLEDNKDKGAYYTPKEIVHYMCQESLIEYLATQLSIENEGIKKALSDFLKNKEFPDELKPFLNGINEALNNVKICDPAIGSGAFPMGLLQEIFSAKQMLYHFEHGTLENFPSAEIKLNIIQNSIYGVDVEKGAVDIARLRFWLSLIIDEELPKPLPNLDYKIVVGNSLVSKLDDDVIDIDWSLDVVSQGIFGVDLAREKVELLKRISEKQKSYFSPKSDKKQLSSEIRNLKIDLLINQLQLMVSTKGNEIRPVGTGKAVTKQLDSYLQTVGWKQHIQKLQNLKNKPNEPLHFFDWKLDFPEVMNPMLVENGHLNSATGFDIVIGNPPYGAKYNEIDKNFFMTKYETAKTISGVQKGSLDTFSLFIESGHRLCNKGSLAYIVPISITSSDSMTGIHNLLENNCSLIKVSSYAVRPQPVFANAVVNTSILFFKRDGLKNDKILSTKMYRKNKNFNLQYLVDNLQFIDVKDVKLIGRYPKISLNIEKQILGKVLSQTTKIRNLIKEEGKPIYYRTTGGRYFKVITNYSTGSTKEKPIFFANQIADVIGAILSSNLFFWFYQIISNNLDLKTYEIESFGIPLTKLNENIISEIKRLYSVYLQDIEQNANIRKTECYANIDFFREYKIGKSKHIIDQIDDLICPLYGLTQKETNFIKNYEIEFRLSDND
ncbi:MAG: hypothetical protein EZS26_000025 [Candidatus Ordinivivax streblomastigis]|uniref:site-specific DNA-methyltransferase (adenine-specific) n=1 Tax=Candidatus Ordinivivax streblomastigis TaxID=2540710 RepID=A0A5M8P517_9BACT|nr:MAG: hypothetical protein EZS26_000025 [Candidatus Ordinivivax streblomastigis]